MGLNGVGKFIIMNIIIGYLLFIEGIVYVDGFDILEELEEVKKRIGYFFENLLFYMDMIV